MKEDFRTFLDISDIPLKDARFVILPIPFEETTSCAKGAKDGPVGIIHSSGYVELYDEVTKTEPYLEGIKTLPEIVPARKNPEATIEIISKTVETYARQNKIVIGLGGEHTVSLGMADAFVKVYPDIKVLCFDAHADLRDSYQETKFSHACVSRRIIELGTPFFSAGIRSISKEEKDFLDKNKQIQIMWAHKMHGTEWDKDLDASLPSGKYYISFDVDFLDPAIMPDTGTPEPGGFNWNETTAFLQRFIARKDISIAGFDVVELSPTQRFTPSAFLAAKLIYKIIGFITTKD